MESRGERDLLAMLDISMVSWLRSDMVGEVSGNSARVGRRNGGLGRTNGRSQSCSTFDDARLRFSRGIEVDWTLSGGNGGGRERERAVM